MSACAASGRMATIGTPMTAPAKAPLLARDGGWPRGATVALIRYFAAAVWLGTLMSRFPFSWQAMGVSSDQNHFWLGVLEGFSGEQSTVGGWVS
jgi:hypothetical protein